MRLPLLPFFLLLTLLAGCADPGPADDGCGAAAARSTDPEGCDPAQPGQIRGVVVDSAISPITGAAVAIASLGLETVTDTDGRFVFSDVAPGAYVVVASAPLFDAVQTPATVPVDGVSEAIRIQLTRIIFDTPYIETAIFDGFLACSSNVGGVIAEECGEGVGVPGVGRIGGNPANKPFVTFYAEGPLPQTIQGEIVWDSTLTVGNGIQDGGFTAIMATHFVCDPVCDYEHSLDDKVGTSPLVMRTDDGDQGGTSYFTDPDVPLAAAGITSETPITVFVWAADDNMAGIMLEQPFTVYRTVSYVLPLPDEWSFARGDPDPF